MAANRARRFGLFVGIALVVVIVDQLTKAWLRASVPAGEPPREVIGDLVRIVHTQNTGGIFGLFGDSAPLLAMASIVVIGLIILYQWRDGSGAHWLLTIALGLLLGGAIGNLIDRLRLGHVTDFVDMGIGQMRWYTFNVADASISTAIVLLILITLVGERLPGAHRFSLAQRP